MTPFERRTRACQDRLADADADATVLFPSRNLLYLSGFDEEPAERHLLLFVPREGAPAFLVPDLYETQVRAESWVADVRTWSDDDDPRDALADIVSDLGLAGGRVLVDDTMWARFSQDLRAALPDADFGLASEVVAPLRARKDDAELDALRRAGAAVDRAVERVRDMGEDAVGMTENELAAEIERLLADEGGEGIPFGPLVGSGPNGAMPHHSHGDRVIESGDPVVLDFGTVVDHYPSDQTRTVVFAGEPPAAFAEVHGVVQAARTAAVETVEPGVAAGDVDRAAREVIEEAGYGDRFIHRTGHGVGLDVHEEPYIVAGSDRELEVGNVFSVEPGVYLPDEFGVRIEDLVVVTDDGAELLNDTDRGWRC
ncbi:MULTISPECIES: aminopeptidase P family protein [unclassified Haloferax]|uniref:aminopeptidase P family protein n=1 Tax=Haloferax TaxID=2251 RepID=UPI0002B1D4F9|nr:MULTISPECIES: Xaa-Pro peptidase family protein [unclassified Haloferax]ELZ59751.1 Xaa-Pro aminopeptidase M24 family protein [Haloferax sp. ATCC BAA-646]ELZ64675.1 Xaa-Pro aminopeptidase M24 family protein [Haloferax sp. ATCC BAA-645]ELZ69491.1 Xaa-Pro aminopeptidase M24 family protein [Haloferax sp. ATCC BAA-644]